MAITPYLFFDGSCRNAFEFYGSVFGVEDLSHILMYSSVPGTAPEDADRVLHCWLPVLGSELMMCDRQSATPPTMGDNIMLTLGFDSIDDQKRVFTALSKGGEVLMPLAPSFFAESYGQVRDRFGIGWQLTCGVRGGVPQQ